MRTETKKEFYLKQMKNDGLLSRGLEGTARFTNSFNNYVFKAVIIKVNNKSLSVRSIEPDKPYKDGDEDRCFNVPRFMAGNWGSNNGFYLDGDVK